MGNVGEKAEVERAKLEHLRMEVEKMFQEFERLCRKAGFEFNALNVSFMFRAAANAAQNAASGLDAAFYAGYLFAQWERKRDSKRGNVKEQTP